MDSAKIPSFFLNLYRHASYDKELKDNDLTVKILENSVDSIENYDRIKGMVVKHSSEWWAPASKVIDVTPQQLDSYLTGRGYSMGWNIPEKAIDGGAEWIENKLIKSK